jgi:predicted transcriptional regulator
MRKIAMAKKREEAAAEKREKERAHQDATLAAMRADLAAGVDLDIVVKRALSAGIKRTPVAEFLGLSRPLVYELAGLGRVLPSWTRERVKLLVSLRSHHSAQEIADALGATRGAVLGKIWRMGLGT